MGEPNSRPAPPVPQDDAPTIRSLRLRHPTRWPHDPARKPDRPIRPLRQLVNVLGPARRDNLGTADAALAASPVPSGRPFHARGSLLSGARKAYRTPVTPVKAHEQTGHCRHSCATAS